MRTCVIIHPLHLELETALHFHKIELCQHISSVPMLFEQIQLVDGVRCHELGF
jgi:hypothetical protein